MRPINFVDLAAQRQVLGNRVDEALSQVLDHHAYIMGPEVDLLEDLIASYADRRHAVTCASGTDALQLALMALGVMPGDRVVVPSFTFVATAEAVCLVGADPVFADVDSRTYALDSESAGSAWNLSGPPPVGIIAVDLFGHPSPTRDLEALAEHHGVWLIVDGAQSFGASRNNRSALSSGVIATTSFYPSKPLGCYGDGGAIFCDDEGLADDLRSLRNHGSSSGDYSYERMGLNSRLDTLQAAVLLAKLEIFQNELVLREELAVRYSAFLEDLVKVPTKESGVESSWAQYTVEVQGRDNLKSQLERNGVPTRVFYPHTLHSQIPYKDYPVVPSGTPVATASSGRVLSLPMHPYLDHPSQDRVVSSVCEFVSGAVN